MDKENDYEQLFHAVPCGILQLKMPVSNLCQVVKINRRAAQILNLQPEQLDAHTLWIPDYLDEDNRKIAAGVFAQLKRPGDQGAFLLKLHNGTVQGEAQLTERDGQPVLQLMFLEISYEITMRRREAEQAEMLESVLQSVHCGVVRFGFQGGKPNITLVNETGWRMLAFESEAQCKVQGLSGFLPRVHPDDRAQLCVHCTFREPNEKITYEFRIYFPGDNMRWISAEMQSLRDVHGNDIIQMTMTDITAQKQIIEQRDAESGEIIQSLGTMYFLILYVDVLHDSYRVIKSEAQSGQEIVSHPYAATLEKQMTQWCTHEKEAAEFTDLMSLAQFQQRYQTGNPLWEHDFQIPVGGSPRYYRMEAVMSGAGGSLLHIVLALRDVTAMRMQELQEHEALQCAYEAAAQASRAKTDFLARMSHDIRTPMNAIVGLTQLMQLHLDEPDKLSSYLEKVNDSSQLLLELINDVLDMSRVESGKLVLDEQPIDLHALVEKIAAIIEPQAQRRRHTFSVENALPRQLVRGDALRIQQIILNILSNCIKFTPDGGKMTWQLWAEPPGSSKYQSTHLRITDSGIGMSHTFLTRIYQPFEREERSDSYHIQGSGLGMTIVHSLVQLMNGWIEIQSTPGAGSSFHIVLPLPLVEQTAQQALPSAPEPVNALPDLHGKRILMVEDNQINMLIACELVKRTGATIEQAVNGQQAVDCFRKHAPGYYDLILMDVRMPVLDGHQAAQAIRHLDRPDAVQIPLIAMTANAFAEDVRDALRAGMNAHLSKPIQVSQLYQTLQSWLGGAQAG